MIDPEVYAVLDAGMGGEITVPDLRRRAGQPGQAGA